MLSFFFRIDFVLEEYLLTLWDNGSLILATIYASTGTSQSFLRISPRPCSCVTKTKIWVCCTSNPTRAGQIEIKYPFMCPAGFYVPPRWEQGRKIRKQHRGFIWLMLTGASCHLWHPFLFWACIKHHVLTAATNLLQPESSVPLRGVNTGCVCVENTASPASDSQTSGPQMIIWLISCIH